MDYELNDKDEILLRAVLDYMRRPPSSNIIVRLYGGTKIYRMEYQEIVDRLPEMGWTEFDVEMRLKRLVNNGILNYVFGQETTYTPCYSLTDKGIDLAVERGLI